MTDDLRAAVLAARSYFNEGRCSGHDQFNGRCCREAAGPERWCIHCAGFMLLQALAALPVPATKPTEHTLMLQFGRFLSQDEWREVADKAWTVPHVRGLRADAVVGASAPPLIAAHSKSEYRRLVAQGAGVAPPAPPVWNPTCPECGEPVTAPGEKHNSGCATCRDTHLGEITR